MKLGKIIYPLIFCTLSSTMYADNNVIYENGVKDTLLIGSRYVKDVGLISNQNTNVVLDGYGVLLNVTTLPESKIIQASAIGVKNGLDVKYINFNNSDFIVFATEKREADAMFLVERLSKYGISANVEKLKGSYKQSTLVAHELIKAINDTLSYLSSRKEDKIDNLNKLLAKKNVNEDAQEYNPIESKRIATSNTSSTNNTTNITLDLSNIQVINRVVTVTFLEKNKVTASTINPFSDSEKSKITKTTNDSQIKAVFSNIKNDSSGSLPKSITNFSEAYKYLRTHSAITKEGYLILHKKAYKVGDKLFAWNISNINYDIGVLVLGNDYTIPLKKD